MSSNEPNRFQLNDSTSHSQSNKPLRTGFQLEKRHAPLVVIAIIAILIGLLVPAVQ